MSSVEGEPWGYGWYENGGKKMASGYLPTIDYPRSEHVSEGPFPLYRHPPTQPSGDVVGAVAERARKFPSDWNWPPSASEDDVNDAIDSLCGCAGKYDCRCVSVFNRTCQQMWWDHNTARAALGE